MSTYLVTLVAVLSIGVAGLSLDATNSQKLNQQSPRNNRSKTFGQGGPIGQCVDVFSNGLDQVRFGLGNHIRAHPRVVATKSPRKVVFGASPGTTGTSSLAVALIQMGLTTAHADTLLPHNYGSWFSEIMSRSMLTPTDRCFKAQRAFDYTSLPDHIDAVLDFPVDMAFFDLFLSFPNAKWLLNTRPSSAWAKSRRKTGSFMALVPPCEGQLQDFSDAQLAHMLDLHNEFVRCVVPPGRLFEFDIPGASGVMHKLGMFLGLPKPPSPSIKFPHISHNQLHLIQQPYETQNFWK